MTREDSTNYSQNTSTILSPKYEQEPTSLFPFSDDDKPCFDDKIDENIKTVLLDDDNSLSSEQYQAREARILKNSESLVKILSRKIKNLGDEYNQLSDTRAKTQSNTNEQMDPDMTERLAKAHTAGFISASLLSLSESGPMNDIKEINLTRVQDFVHAKLRLHPTTQSFTDIEQHMQKYVHEYINKYLELRKCEQEEEKVYEELSIDLTQESVVSSELTMINTLMEAAIRSNRYDQMQNLQAQMDIEKSKFDLVELIGLQKKISNQERQRLKEEMKEEEERHRERTRKAKEEYERLRKSILEQEKLQKERMEQAMAEEEYIEKVKKDFELVEQDCKRPVRGSKRKINYAESAGLDNEENGTEESVEEQPGPKRSNRTRTGRHAAPPAEDLTPNKKVALPSEESTTTQQIDYLLQSKESPLAVADLKELIPHLLDQFNKEDRKTLAALLPSSDVTSTGEMTDEFLEKGNTIFWESTDIWQSMLSAGSFDPSRKRKVAEEKTPFKDDQYEHFWGEKLNKAKKMPKRSGRPRK